MSSGIARFGIMNTTYLRSIVILDIDTSTLRINKYFVVKASKFGRYARENCSTELLHTYYSMCIYYLCNMLYFWHKLLNIVFTEEFWLATQYTHMMYYYSRDVHNLIWVANVGILSQETSSLRWWYGIHWRKYTVVYYSRSAIVHNA